MMVFFKCVNCLDAICVLVVTDSFFNAKFIHQMILLLPEEELILDPTLPLSDYKRNAAHESLINK